VKDHEHNPVANWLAKNSSYLRVSCISWILAQSFIFLAMKINYFLMIAFYLTFFCITNATCFILFVIAPNSFNPLFKLASSSLCLFAFLLTFVAFVLSATVAKGEIISLFVLVCLFVSLFNYRVELALGVRLNQQKSRRCLILL
jgi:hypothetical protein